MAIEGVAIEPLAIQGVEKRVFPLSTKLFYRGLLLQLQIRKIRNMNFILFR